MREVVVSGLGRSVIHHREIARPAPGWVNVRVRAAGLCGSDRQRIDAGLPRPSVLGHEIAGAVDEVGAGATVKPGQRVVCMPLVSCRACAPCASGFPQCCLRLRSLGKDLPGGFAEIVAAPAANLCPIPAGLDYAAASMADVVAVAVHARHLAEDPQGLEILVIGDGPVGLTLAALLASDNAVTVLGRHHRSTAVAYGARFLTAVSEARYDLVLEAVGRDQAKTLHEAIHAIRPSGRVVALGVYPAGYEAGLPLRDLFYKEGRVLGSNSYLPEELGEALALMSTRVDVSRLISHRLPLDHFEDCCELVRRRGQTGAIKVVLEP